MARIPMRSGFTLVPEGHHEFKIEAVNYDERFGKLEIKLKTASGMTHTEHFMLLNNDGKTLNEKALNAFSYFAKAALNNFTLDEGDEIDPMELIGHFIAADVRHDVQPKKDKKTGEKIEGETTTFIRLDNKTPCEGFTDQPQTQAAAPAAPKQRRSWL